MTASRSRRPVRVGGGAEPPRAAPAPAPGPEALADLLAFARRAVSAAPRVVRVALLDRPAAGGAAHPVAVILGGPRAGAEDLRAVRRAMRPAAARAAEAGHELALRVVPQDDPRAAMGVTLWPPVAGTGR